MRTLSCWNAHMAGMTAILLGLVACATAGIPLGEKAELSGWGWVTLGRFESSHPDSGSYDADFDGRWTEDVQMGLKLTYRPTERTRITLHGGGIFQQPAGLWNSEYLKVGSLMYMYPIQMSFHADFGDSERYPLYLDFGFFPIKYNANSMNLGEYLFRSGVYPPYLVSGFEWADKVKGLGLRVGGTVLGSINQELYLLSEIAMRPLYDFSVAYLLRYTPSEIFEIGGGIMGSRVISVDEEATTPALAMEEDDWLLPQSRLYVVVDSSTADTTNLTFTGGKAALFFSVHPFARSDSKIMAKSDLALYGEMAVLGFRDYDVWYEDITERIPVTLGLNLPTHSLMSWGTVAAISLLGLLDDSDLGGGLHIPSSGGALASWLTLGAASWALERFLGWDTRLDRLALEVEWYGSPWTNSPQAIIRSESPAPYTHSQVPEYYQIEKHHDDDWKWSLYASKKIGSFMQISGQIANDNIPRSKYGGGIDYPITLGKEDWYWMLRTKFFF